MKSGCKVVDQVGEMKIEGNLVPHLWYKNITFAGTGGQVPCPI